ncbi:MAG: iron-containing alcohol dehydrogenase [Rubrivivax sp.]
MKSGRVAFSRMQEVVFGRPAAAVLTEMVSALDARRVFIIASGTLNRQTDAVQRITVALGDRLAGVFDRVPAHSPRQAVVEAAAAAREAGADLVLSVGGGSVIDAGKAVPLCLANDVRDADALDALRPAPGDSAAPPGCRAPPVPHLAVPTTLSAGEFSAIAGLTNERTRVKELFRHPGLIPLAVVLDPAMTVHTPPGLFLSTGIRAVDHCVEGFSSPEAQAFADAQALHGLRLLAAALPRVHDDPSDLGARLDCQLGAWLSMAPVATGVPMGASHGIGYVLGAGFGVPHGHTSCVMLPAVLRWNRPAAADRQAQLAAAMGAPADDAATLLDRLIAGLGLPRRLSDVGIGREQFDRIAQQALATPWVPRNPRPISSAEQVREILELAA